MVGVVVGFDDGDSVADFVGPGVVRGVGRGLDTDGDGDGDGVSARAADAVLPARTTPVPTVMISGFRTDRASTAYNLLNDRL